MRIFIGTCGWNYFSARKYIKDWRKRYKSRLEVYSTLFNVVEVNSTFYKLPKIEIAKKWYNNTKNLKFVVKMPREITHIKHFIGCSKITNDALKIADILHSDILLFQSPASFKPTKENLKKAETYFKKLKKKTKKRIVWEVRWKNTWNKDIVKKIFSKLNINQCIDPFRQDFIFAKDIFYFRLHGLGKNMMYNYKFNKKEINWLRNLLNNLDSINLDKKKRERDAYILFNNFYMFDDALRLKKLL